jgi:hypothetical protein
MGKLSTRSRQRGASQARRQKLDRELRTEAAA